MPYFFTCPFITNVELEKQTIHSENDNIICKGFTKGTNFLSCSVCCKIYIFVAWSDYWFHARGTWKSTQKVIYWKRWTECDLQILNLFNLIFIGNYLVFMMVISTRLFWADKFSLTLILISHLRVLIICQVCNFNL